MNANPMIACFGGKIPVQFIFSLVLFNLVPIDSLFGQQSVLKFNELKKSEKEIVIKENDLVYLKYFISKSSSGNKGNLRSVQGRVLNFNDSSLTLKKNVSRKELIIPLEKIYRIRKEQIGRYVSMAILPTALGLINILYFPVPPYFIALSMIPSTLIYDLFFPRQSVKYPFKYDIIEY